MVLGGGGAVDSVVAIASLVSLESVEPSSDCSSGNASGYIRAAKEYAAKSRSRSYITSLWGLSMRPASVNSKCPNASGSSQFKLMRLNIRSCPSCCRMDSITSVAEIPADRSGMDFPVSEKLASRVFILTPSTRMPRGRLVNKSERTLTALNPVLPRVS